MNVSELNIRRPVMSTLVMIGILIAGVMGYRLLPVSDLPNVDFPTILVTALLPGASPETMASAVATPLEKQFSTIAGVDSMSSASQQGSTQITITFTLDRNIDAAAQDVQSSIAKVLNQLPKDMPSPPSYQKVNPADQPVLFLALTSDTLTMSKLDEYGETTMAQRISMVSGIAQVLVYGSQKYAVRIQLDPQQMFARGVGVDQVSAAIAGANVNLPTGVLYGPHKAFTVEAEGQLYDAAAYRPIVVAYHNGAPVRLSDVALVHNSVENDKTAAWYVDKDAQRRSIILAVQRQPGTNTVEVTEAVKDLLPSFEKQLPKSVSIHVLYDRSESIKQSVDDVKFTLILTLCLVVMVIFLFLRNVSATIIPSLTLPLSIIGTFGVMYALGYSLDNLSLMALTLSVGFVVDDAIVMLENIVRHAEMGKSIMQAALEGSREIGFTIISMTLSLAAVFIPVLFMGGLVGKLFREFAVTIGVAILVSGFVSLTLIPMLGSRFLKPPHLVHHGAIYMASEKVFNLMLAFYRWSLGITLRYKPVTLLVSIGILAATVYLIIVIPKSFLPSEDRGLIFCQTEGIEGISFDSLKEHQQAAAAVIQEDPNVDSAMSATAGVRAGFGASNTGVLFMRLKPRDQFQFSVDDFWNLLTGKPTRPRGQRKLHVDDVITELRPKFAKIPGFNVYSQNPGAINPSGRLTQGQYQYTLVGADTAELYRYSNLFLEELKKLPGFLDVSSDLKLKNPQVNVKINRDKASTLGVSAGQLEDSLFTAYGSRQISTIYAPNDQYEVIVEFLPEYQLFPSNLSMLYVTSASGQIVPMSSIVDLEETVGPLVVNHTGQLPSVTVSFNLKPDVSLGTASDEVVKTARNTIPATISGDFQGTAQAFKSSMSGMMLLFGLAILVIYIVLGILYESFIHPITILIAVPFAGFGALVALIIFNMDLSLYSFVGLIMLVGLVKKNGIMMIDFAIASQREGKPPQEAIFEACQIRFRPIMMTTFAALMAGLPIATGIGAGAESRRPLGIAVVGGLLFSQALTMYVTPVFYLYLDKIRQFFERRRERRLAAAQGARK